MGSNVCAEGCLLAKDGGQTRCYTNGTHELAASQKQCLSPNTPLAGNRPVPPQGCPDSCKDDPVHLRRLLDTLGRNQIQLTSHPCPELDRGQNHGGTPQRHLRLRLCLVRDQGVGAAHLVADSLNCTPVQRAKETEQHDHTPQKTPNGSWPAPIHGLPKLTQEEKHSTHMHGGPW